jgi:hypothetical protein
MLKMQRILLQTTIIPKISIVRAFASAVTVIVAVATIIISSPEPGTIPPTHELQVFQFPPVTVLVIVADQSEIL